MDLVLPLAQAYAENYTSNSSELLEELLRHTQETHPKSHMVSGQWQGRFLYMLSALMKPLRILEIGTFTGYSALCLAEGLDTNGLLHTIESRHQDAATAQTFFDRSPLRSKIILHLGEAGLVIPQLKETWDLVFIDADKIGYADYLDDVWPSLRPGGLIIADNVLFHGELLKPELKGKNPKALQAFNDKIRNSEGMDFVLIPVRDGLMLIRKK